MSIFRSCQTLTSVVKNYGTEWMLLGFAAVFGYGIGKVIEVSEEALAEYVQKKKERDQIKWLLENKTFGAAISSKTAREENAEDIACPNMKITTIQQDNKANNLDN